jgi:PAS domain S-box-containing protein
VTASIPDGGRKMRPVRAAADKSQSPLSGLASEETLLSSQFLETIPDAIVAVQGDGTILQVNSQTEQLFGYTRGELIGQKIEVLVPQRFRGAHRGHRSSFAQEPKIRRMGAGLDLKGRRRDGSEFDVEISLSPVTTEAGTIVLSAIRDISDRKRTEAELRRVNEELDKRTAKEIGEYRARLASIIDSSEDAIIGKDLDGTITSWNRGAQRMYGHSPEEVVGQNISLLTSKDRPDEIPSILARIKRGEHITHYESIRVTKDGRRLSVSISISPIRDAGGVIVGASAIARDVTEQKRAEEHLRQAQKMEAVGRLAGGLAHDFNNILGIITACTELLRGRVETTEESAPYISNIRKAVERGTSLTRQLLAFTRKTAVNPQLIDLNTHLREVAKLIRPLMGDDVEIVVQPRCESAIVEVDPGQFDQIVLNLGINSRDAMPRGGKFILETSSMQLDDVFTEQHRPMKPGHYIVLAVSDTGVGMDQTTASRIFEPFFTTKEVGKGTGLGLATVYGIVQHSGGHIWVYSEPGRGTTFKIYLPSAEEKLGVTIQPAAEAPVRRRDGTTILLVEDDEIMLSLTRQLLVENGFTVLEAKDGTIALELVRSHPGPIHVLLTDVVMRGMSGPELVTAVSKSHPSVKTIFMSGYTGELIAQNRPAILKVPLLEKPFTRAALYKILDTTLGNGPEVTAVR